jgi:hypothetical protein
MIICFFSAKMSRRNHECSGFIIAERYIDMPVCGVVVELGLKLDHRAVKARQTYSPEILCW